MVRDRAAALESRLLRNQCGHHRSKRPLITPEAPDHGVERRVRIEPIEIERVPGTIGEQSEKGQLSSSVALPERMDRIDLRQEMRGPPARGQ